LAALAALTAEIALAQQAAPPVPIARPIAVQPVPAAPAQGPAATVMPIMTAVSERVAQADAIVVGKVTGMEKDKVSARTTPQANQKVEYQIAMVKINDALRGVKGLTDIRVGFIARPNIIPPPPKGGGPQPLPPVRPAIAIYQPNLTVGQEGVLFLNKHFEGDFYLLTGYQSVINKQNNNNYEKELAQVKRCIKLLADPTAGLKAKESAERLLTASLLVSHYRAYKPGMTYPIKTEPIDTKESKQILKILADADWNTLDPEFRINAQHVFNRLQLTQKDGWTFRFDRQKGNNYSEQYFAAAKEWLKKNADTYRIQRYVYEKPAKKESKTK
jgi:hypothetical protein